MAEDVGAAPPIRLMNFVSENQLEESKKSRGERLEDGTAQRDRPLFEILRENKDKKDAEFNERFKHRPPKALDEDETEFLDHLELSRKQHERHIADEEAQQFRHFQAAVAAQSLILQDVKETPPISSVQEPKRISEKKNPRPLGMIVKVKPVAKKPKLDPYPGLEPRPDEKHPAELQQHLVQPGLVNENHHNGNDGKGIDMTKTGLVLYSDESDDD